LPKHGQKRDRKEACTNRAYSRPPERVFASAHNLAIHYYLPLSTHFFATVNSANYRFLRVPISLSVPVAFHLEAERETHHF